MRPPPLPPPTRSSTSDRYAPRHARILLPPFLDTRLLRGHTVLVVDVVVALSSRVPVPPSSPTLFRSAVVAGSVDPRGNLRVGTHGTINVALKES